MAFKMKGSAFKLGNVATKSALKQRTNPIDVTRTKTERSAEDKAAIRGKAEPKVEKKPGDPKLEKITRKEDPSQWKGPLPQKLSIGEKLSAAKDAITGMHPESGFGDIYKYYKTGKKNRRAEKRRAAKAASKTK
jgi:hypothetical protein